MDASDMSPPVKRRKLSDSTVEERYGDDDGALDGISAYEQAIEAYHRHMHEVPSQADAQAGRQGHAQEVKRASGNVGAKVLLHRQDDNIPVPSVPAMPTFGVQTFSDAFTTITFTPPATPSLPTLPLVPAATTAPTSSQAETTAGPPSSIPSPDPSASPAIPSPDPSVSSAIPSPDPSASSAIPSPDPSASSAISATNGTSSVSSSSSSSSSLTSTMFISNSTMTSTTISTAIEATSGLFIATFGNGEVSTIPRSSNTFTTTLSGSTFTVSGYGSLQTDESSASGPGTVTSTMEVTAGGGYDTSAATGPSISTTTAADSDDGHSDMPPAGTIAGGVVGGAAGLAVLVLIAMLFVRWYRRKGRTGLLALPANSTSSPALSRDEGPGMAESAGMIHFAAAVPALFRQGNGGELAEPPERGFTRVSGRKLPSQWSEGMSGPQPPNMPLTAQTSGPEAQRKFSSISFPRDRHGFYSGDGGETISPIAVSPSSDVSWPLRNNSGDITMSPGPERQPTFHRGGPYHVSQPGMASRGFGRSDTPSSLDPARSSRFTEDM